MASDNALTEEDSIIDMSLEPVLVLARLSQISLYPVGTKLYLREGMIRIHTNGIMQPFVRWVGGDSREDLTYLFDPIRKFTEIYRSKTTKDQRTIMKRIVSSAVTGLEKLRETYGSHKIVDHSLAYYQTFLIQCADLKVHVSGVKRSPFMNLREPSNSTDDIPPLELSEKVLPEPQRKSRASKLVGVWTMDDIQMLSTMLEEAQDAEGDDQKKSKLKTIESFLESKELEIKKAIDTQVRP
jgi:hypothetical protein